MSIDNTEWYLIVNGHDDRNPLLLFNIDASGNVDGSMSTSGNHDKGIPLEDAKWDEAARELTFKVTLENGEIQTYVGFVFDQAPPNVKVQGLDRDFVFAMAGTFTGDRFEDPQRPGFGWFALGVGRFI